MADGTTVPDGDDGGDGIDNRYYDLLVHLSQNLEEYLIYVFYVTVLFVIITEVFRRFVLSLSSEWGTEIARIMYLWITYLGISLAVYKRSHIRIDYLYHRVSQQTKNYLYLFSDAALFAFGLYAIWYTIPLISATLEFGSTTMALRIHRAWFQGSVIIGLGLMMIRIVQRTYHDVRDIRAGRPVYEGESIFGMGAGEEEEEI